MKIYNSQTLRAYIERYAPRSVFEQGRANSLGTVSLQQIGIEHRMRRAGVMRELMRGLQLDYDRYVKTERPIIYQLEGHNLWVNSAAAPFTIEVLQRIRANSDSVLAHSFPGLNFRATA